MDGWHRWLAWMAGMEADLSYFYILITDRLTDGRTLVPLKLLSLLKTTLKLNLELWVGPLDFNVSQSLNYLRLKT